MNNDVSIIIQGPLNKISLGNINNYLKYGKVIISCYENDDLTLIKEEVLNNKNVEIVKNKNIDISQNIFNQSNIFFQAYTCYNGAIKSNSKFTIKFRSDAYYSNLDKLMYNIKNYPDRIHSLNSFFLRDSYEKFHPSDHMFASKTDFFIKAMDFAYHICYKENRSKYDILENEIHKPNGAKYLVYNKNNINFPIKNEIQFCFGFLIAKGIEINPKNSYEIMYSNYCVTMLDDFVDYSWQSSAHPGPNKIDIFKNHKDIVNHINNIKYGNSQNK